MSQWMRHPGDDGPRPESSTITSLRTADVAETDSESRERESLVAVVGGYLRILMRRKLIVLLVLAGVIGAGWLWLQQQVPVYRATAKVIIYSEPPRIFQNVRDVVELGAPRDFRGQMAFFETQYRIIRSTDVAEAVLDREGLWNDRHLLGFDRVEGLSEADIQKRIANIHQPTLLAGRINVRPVPNSMLVQIDFDDSDPAFAQRLVNAVAYAYRDTNVRYKKKIVEEATEDLRKATDQKKNDVKSAEEALRAFEKQHNVGSIEAQKAAIDERMKRLNNELTELRIQRNALEAKWKSLSRYAKGGDPFKVQNAALLDNEVIRLLKQQLVSVEAELAQLKARYLEKHPDVVAREQQAASLTAIARREIQNIAESVRRQLDESASAEAGLVAGLEAVRVEQQAISDIALEYARMQEARTTVKETEQLFSKRLSEMSEASRFEGNNVRVLEEAIQPGAPISPRRMIVLAGSVLLGFILAFAFALLVDYADATVKDWRDIEERLGQKVLGVIPVIGGRAQKHLTPEERRERDLYIHANPTSPAAEASRSLRTNLLFMASTRRLDVLLVTSASPSEGKSMMATHIATSVAASGSRVLLVEADMRRPRLAGSFGVDDRVGLSSALVGNDSIDRYTQRSPIANLDVMTCGPIPPNPAELLHTQRFLDILSEMKQRYDTVIFDSPPLLPVSDALIIAQQVGGVLVVVRAGQTSRHALRHALRGLRGVQAPVLGVVLNYLSPKKGGGYGYGYGYGAGGYYGTYQSRRDEKKNAEA
jgi:succinoglycan biosynthesis transport protein ExoP